MSQWQNLHVEWKLAARQRMDNEGLRDTGTGGWAPRRRLAKELFAGG